MLLSNSSPYSELIVLFCIWNILIGVKPLCINVNYVNLESYSSYFGLGLRVSRQHAASIYGFFRQSVSLVSVSKKKI